MIVPAYICDHPFATYYHRSWQYSRKGSAMLFCMYEIKNKNFVGDKANIDEDEEEVRLMPRSEALPIYTMAEFNDKVSVFTSLLSYAFVEPVFVPYVCVHLER